MKKVMRKVKCQWITAAIMGATIVALGAVDVPQIAAVEGNDPETTVPVEDENFSAISTEPGSVTDSISDAPIETTITATSVVAKSYVQILSTADVFYEAIISRGTDAINTAPWGTEGYETVSHSSAYLNTEVSVSQEQLADNGVLWALISVNGKELGWIAKDALQEQKYAQSVSEKAVDYSATVNRGTDAINTAPWGAKGFRTIGNSSAYLGTEVSVSQEKVMDYGVTWALISVNGQELGWIAKDALKEQMYAQSVSEKAVDYSATVSRGTDAINTAPWGAKGFRTIGNSSAYLETEVTVSQEKVMDYGVTWALISVNGQELGWIAKDALKEKAYAQITKETAVSYDAIVNRDSDAINTAPWGTKGYRTTASSADYLGQTIEVTKEQTTDYGVTWAQISQNGEILGWIAKDALREVTYAQIVSETEVAYPALISRGSDAINTAPWGTKGYQTKASSADYLNQTIEVTKEQTTDYGVTWAQISVDGQELGWIAKDALTALERKTETKTSEIGYPTIEKEDATIPAGERWTVQSGSKGYDTATYEVDYADGIEIGRREVGRTTKAVREEIVKVGTQQVNGSGEPGSATRYHRVANGDTLWGLYYKYGQTLDRLLEWNDIVDPNHLSLGQLISVDGYNRYDAILKEHQIFASEEEFLAYIIPVSQRLAAENGLYASVMIAQAIHESDWGTSGLTTLSHNLFGIKGTFDGNSVEMPTNEVINGELITITAGFRAYSSLDESARDYVHLLLNQRGENGKYYASAWMENTTSYKDATAHLQGRYATDPNYAARLDKYIVTYELYKYDSPDAGTPTSK
ncbi:GW dipeptide domain-containing protein [Trichococcus shcherbakoviae]|uniref:Peptidoglycan hydrolase n=1 Tax=Trichococcus shcherbakoviae subsp. psychrophilus TaxID=2585775 RepID=A0A5C5E6H1_9LACT|nr:GW dipeptide domain-containing protein [Trichococcus shcherbakoviae]TNV68389.1 LysM peptidoglycan-binding domain-containing protein [Trichococcus shcherbakoviae subsp. psychrophilus]